MDAQSKAGMRIAILIKQIPTADSLRLGADGRLVRDGLALEINPFCRRAITLGVSLARDAHGECVALTLAPPSGEDVLREAIAAGADFGVLISDPAFAGSDTLATARALAATLRTEGPFDIVVCGRNSVDADTGQVGPELATLLDVPFIASAKEIKLLGREVFAKSERDDGWALVRATLPAVLSVAERSSAPARADKGARAAVPADRIRRITAGSLGSGPWGQAGSPTRVGEVRLLESRRHRKRLTGPLTEQVREAVRLLTKFQGSLAQADRVEEAPLQRSNQHALAPSVAAILEPARDRSARGLCATAALLARQLNTTAVGLVAEGSGDWALGPWPLDQVVAIRGATVEEDVARAVAAWTEDHKPAVILASGSLWGREVAARVAASLGLGLIGDAVEVEVSQGRVSAWKPAFGGRLMARICTDSDPQLITLRMGSIPSRRVRCREVTFTSIEARSTERIKVLKRVRDDDAEVLFSAHAVVGVGMGVCPSDYQLLDPLLETLGAPLACSRKVADRGWLPRTRQVGLTGHHIAPQLYVAVGLQGNTNHAVGIRRAGVILAINSDPDAPIFDDADIGIVGDWRQAVQLLVPLLAAGQHVPKVEIGVSKITTDQRDEMYRSYDEGKAMPEAGRA